MKSYTTRYGTVIPGRILADVLEDIRNGVDYQRTITDHLRDPIPVHEDGLDEANEVYNHVQEIFEDEVWQSETDSILCDHP